MGACAASLILTKTVYAALMVGALTYATSAPVTSLEGWVREDHTGARVTGATVRVSPVSAAGTGPSTRTDGAGRFSLTNLPTGRHRLEVEKPNFVRTIVYVDIMAEGGAVESGQQTAASSLVVPLIPLGVIEGRVEGAVAGDVVAVERVDGAVGTRVFRSRISPDGEFRIFGLLAGRYAVGLMNVRTPERLRRGVTFSEGSGAEVVVAGTEQRITLHLPVDEPVPVTGSVRTSASTTSSVGIALFSTQAPRLQVWAQIVSPAATFTIPDLLPGQYSLTATARPVVDSAAPLFGRASLVVTPGSAVETAIDMAPGASATVTTQTIGDRDNCSGRTVTFVPLESWLPPSMTRSMPFDRQASITITDLAPTRYQVSVETGSPDCVAVRSNLDVTATHGRVSVAMGPYASIRARVVAPEDQRLQYSVLVADETPGRDASLHLAPASAGAQVVFDHLEPGAYRVSAFPTARQQPIGPSLSSGVAVVLSLGDHPSIEIQPRP